MFDSTFHDHHSLSQDKILPLRLGIIDLGTNSVRFDVYDISKDHKIERIFREKNMIRLGDDLFRTQMLSREHVKRAEGAFDSIHTKIKKLDVKRVVALATSAMRDAKNSSVIIEKIMERTGILIRILPGEDEARLIAKGIINNENIPDGVYGLIDIGGGSTEVSICHKRSIVDSYSFALGANRLQQLWLKKSPPDTADIQALRSHISSLLNDVIRVRGWPKITNFIASSGTSRAFAKLIKGSDVKISFSTKELTEIVQEIETLNKDKIIDLPHMDPKRADMILSGGILLDETMRAFGTTEIAVSRYTLRDGIIENEFEKLLTRHKRSPEIF